MGKMKTTEEFIQQAREVHGDFYSYEKSIYINSYTKLIITCPIHGDFKQEPHGHLKGNKCLICSNDLRRKSTKKFIEEAIKIHGDKYNYSLTEYIQRRKKIIIICPEHGKFKQQPDVHLRGGGCPKCVGKYNLTNEEFIKEAQKIHGNKYDYSLTNFISFLKNVKIICTQHGIFIQRPKTHLNGGQCSKCIKEQKLKKQEEIFFTKVKKAHGDKYDYSLSVYSGIKCKMKIICPKHGVFEQIAGDHKNGSGCPNCKNTISKPSQIWLDSLNNKNILREERIIVNNKFYKADGFDPTTNTIYEFDGDFWHGNPEKYNPEDINPISKKTYGELYEITLKRREIFVQAGYKLVSIWESEWKGVK